MKSIFFVCLILVSSFAHAQFAITNDTDGYCNVRRTAAKSNNVIDRLENGHLIFCLETNGDWMNIDYTKNAKELNGQIHKSRAVKVSTYLSIPLLEKSNVKVILGRDSVRITLIEQKFNKARHKLVFAKGHNNQLTFIDGKKFWGTDGEIPKTEYQSLTVFLGKQQVSIPQSALKGLYEVNLSNTQVNQDKKNDMLYISSYNSDGAGGYYVIWAIEKGHYKERFIAYGF